MSDLPPHIAQRIEREVSTILRDHHDIDRNALIRSMSAIANYAMRNPFAPPKPKPESTPEPIRHVALPETQQETIVRLHQAGETIESITRSQGVTHTTVYRILKQAGIKERRIIPWTEAEDWTIRHEHMLTVTKLAEALPGRTEAAIRRRRLDLRKRDEQAARERGESVLS